MLKQQQEVIGFDSEHYLSRLLWAASTNGAQVPVSVAYRGGESTVALLRVLRILDCPRTRLHAAGLP